MKPHLWRRSWAGKYLRRVPRIKHLRGTWLHRTLGDRFFDPRLWQWDRHGTALGLAIGAFFSVIPMPLQSVPAALGAVLFRVNVPAALVGCWITNPLTFPLFLYLQLVIGSYLLGRRSLLSEIGELPLVELFKAAPGVLVVGGLGLGAVMATLTYFGTLGVYDLIIRAIQAKSARVARSRGATVKPGMLK